MLRWAIRLSQWFRRPPSRQRVILMIVVLVACLLAVAAERLFGWPAALTVTPSGRIHRP